MPKKESTESLKHQLKELQDKIALLEEKQTTQSQDLPIQNVEAFKVVTLYRWESPERIFIRRNSRWFIYLFLLVLLIIVVLLFAWQLIIVAAVAAFGVVIFILATVPPQEVEHKLTTEGLNTSGHSYLWQELSDFWITKKGDEKLIHIDTYLDFPRRLIILSGKGNLEEIKEIMTQYIPFREIPKETMMDKVFNRLTEKFHKFAS